MLPSVQNPMQWWNRFAPATGSNLYYLLCSVTKNIGQICLWRDWEAMLFVFVVFLLTGEFK
jgi:hypothetical protein